MRDPPALAFLSRAPQKRREGSPRPWSRGPAAVAAAMVPRQGPGQPRWKPELQRTRRKFRTGTESTRAACRQPRAPTAPRAPPRAPSLMPVLRSPLGAFQTPHGSGRGALRCFWTPPVFLFRPPGAKGRKRVDCASRVGLATALHELSALHGLLPRLGQPVLFHEPRAPRPVSRRRQGGPGQQLAHGSVWRPSLPLRW